MAAAQSERVKEPATPEEYYGSLSWRGQGWAHIFKDFDDPYHFRDLETKIKNPSSRNFVIDFGEDSAWCGFDLAAANVDELLRSTRPPLLNTRWINIWSPFEQTEFLQALAKHYDFSPRLLGVMKSAPNKISAKSTSHGSHLGGSVFSHMQYHLRQRRQDLFHEKDVEGLPHTTNSVLDPTPDKEWIRDFNHWNLVDEVWHWSSVDWGRRYVCMGYNSLYNVKVDKLNDGEASSQSGFLPDGKRVWTWLVLCEDKTVITINEDPYPYKTGGLTQEEIANLNAIRRNIHNVFRNLSKSYDISKEVPMTVLPIRHRVGNSEEETIHRPTDAPGLLFYYLFDDWFSSYSIVVRREHQYAAKLDELRKDMLYRADLHHIDRLHHIGRQLAVLKRVYQSYDTLIERVLEKREATLASLKNSHVLPTTGTTDMKSAAESVMMSSQQNITAAAEPESVIGVQISSAARVRFSRLQYRIRLYALSEIQECLDQKESLVMMNFNLIAIKESSAVERLTRVTLLLAKFTILFMPVSIVTGYFSTQLEGITFTQRSFWLTFGMTLLVSVVLLIAFSVLSGTMEGAIMYRSFSRFFWEMMLKPLWKRMRGQRHERP
ncbi:hypothetical protein BDY21DRAFT_279153 [Lineolata rhizophorae]|uniref:ADP-ribosylation factor n=1 Tax=Lineolata rhizophorae TaxID=578093 RepID=A0A6A6PB47_9PEZI|nr:hypothetical protein BDY21DRAFT_279153 [Lineolata rhizophorae]